MHLLLIILAMYGAVAGVMALAASCVLPRLGKNPRFAVVFSWCVVALFVLNILWAASPRFDPRWTRVAIPRNDGMSDEHHKANLWLWGSAPLLALPALYVGGYFALGESTGTGGATVRSYRSSAIAFAYAPLAWLESKVRRRDVFLGMPGRSELGGRMIHFEP
jgi:drug/metabolite transporter (DMT)-like permease